MLHHPSLHEALMTVREQELSRRDKRSLRIRRSGPFLPARHLAASLLRQMADRLDPHPRRTAAAQHTTVPAGR